MANRRNRYGMGVGYNGRTSGPRHIRRKGIRPVIPPSPVPQPPNYYQRGGTLGPQGQQRTSLAHDGNQILRGRGSRPITAIPSYGHTIADCMKSGLTGLNLKFCATTALWA